MGAPRGRMVERVADAGGSQSQPDGFALPSLLPTDLLSKHTHIAHALACDPLAILLEASTSVRAKLVVTRCVNSPLAVIGHRVSVLRTLSEMSGRQRPLRERRVDQLPGKLPAAGINFPLISALASTLEYADKDLVDDISWRMAIVGNVKASGALTSRERKASSSADSWRGQIPPRKKLNAERVKRSRGSDEDKECWEQTVKEIQRGWLSPHDANFARSIENHTFNA